MVMSCGKSQRKMIYSQNFIFSFFLPGWVLYVLYVHYLPFYSNIYNLYCSIEILDHRAVNEDAIVVVMDKLASINLHLPLLQQ